MLRPDVPQLITRARDGDTAALSELIRAYQQPIGHYVLSEGGSREDYLDICQTVFVKMMKGLSRLRSPEVFEPWLYQIARNACTDHLRKESRRRKIFEPLTDAHEVAAPADEPLSDARKAEVTLAMAALSPEQRRVLALSMEKRHSYEELAGLTGWSIASVRNRLARARERLRRAMKS